ncbi:MAG TPA: PQQ-dependent sugar dehydrogenase [Acidimicrobiia bacterium]|nr:PQQ-dependent sugar dehydrogenase [Acidimicrobiia bacterium]
MKRLGVLFITFATVLGLGVSAFAQTSPGGSFTDDDGSIHEADVEAIAVADITRGCNPPWNDEFCPGRSVTRGEMAAFLTRALNLPAGPDRFVDDALSVFQDDINALAASDVTRGCNPPENDRFCPDRPVTRGEMAAFLTRAYGYVASESDVFEDDDSSIFEGDIDALASADVTRGCNPPESDRFCPDDPVTRAQMASFLVRAEGLPTEPVPSRPEVGLTRLSDDLQQPVYAVAPPGDERIFVVEKGGTIEIFAEGSIESQPFLDVSDRVVNQGEMGLLSMAFHPEFPQDDRVFIYYSTRASDGGLQSQISSFQLSPDPDVLIPVETPLLTIPQPASNHNGGHLLFDPDGYLVVALGDGGGSNDTFGNGQNANTLLGSLLRIDIDAAFPYSIPSENPFLNGPGRDEIWAVGLRNPWRIWFDDGLLYVADVGQGSREEVTVVGDDRPLVNYGWPRFEGSICNPNDDDQSCASSGMEFPDLEYSHSAGVCSITGGVVYRGEALHWLQGHYFYGDLCGGFIRSFRTPDGSRIDDRQDWTSRLGSVGGGLWSFGVDGAGEMLVVSGSGSLFRLEAE